MEAKLDTERRAAEARQVDREEATMADSGLFMGWGAPVRGRETVGLGVFNEAIGFWSAQQEAGAIESFETVLLEPHGGDLAGFFLVRGTQEQIAAARASEDFRRLNIRANMIVEGFGFVGAILGDGLGDAIGLYAAAAGEFGG
jgi:hypothetical protein